MPIQGANLNFNGLAVDCDDQVDGTIAMAWAPSAINRFDLAERCELSVEPPHDYLLRFEIIDYQPTACDVLHL